MRDIRQCHPKLQKLADELVTACERKGMKIGISECLRTAAEQDALYAKGRTAPGNVVTNARGSSYSSMHQWGVAFDFYRNDGKGTYEDSDGFFSKVGAVGQTLGLEGGGSWTSIKDKPHFQLPDWGSTATKLKQLYGTPEKFMATWESARDDGRMLEPKKFTNLKTTFLRKEPKTGNASKVKYRDLGDTLKEKCRKDPDGWAKFLAGKTFDRVKSMTDAKGNKWFQTKSGYWLPAVYGGEKRVRAV